MLNGWIETIDIFGRILIADPDETVARKLTDLFQREGYPCTPVRDGLEAIQALEANEYHLLIAEIQMPGNEELELVQAAQQHEEGMPVILHTARPSLRSAIASNQLPVAAYLIKPVQPRVLMQHVKTNIANFQALKLREALLERTIVYAWAIEETIRVLEDTRSNFKSNKLAALRRQLERILAGEQPA